MPPSETSQQPHRRETPFVVVVDSNVFLHRSWLQGVIDLARNGYIRPIWSPLIIAEVNRQLTWLWIKRNNGDVSPAAKRKCSVSFKKWFSIMTTVFRVVDDRPPQESMWTTVPPDEWDVPIWTAAVRSRALFVVTDDRKQMPPKNSRGLEMFRGVIFLKPDEFLQIVNEYVEDTLGVETLGLPDVADADDASNQAKIETPEHSVFEEVRRVLENMNDAVD